MECPKCGSKDVLIQMVQTNTKSKHKKNSIATSAARASMVLMTGGLWALTPKRKGSSKEKISNVKLAICQNCANEFKVK